MNRLAKGEIFLHREQTPIALRIFRTPCVFGGKENTIRLSLVLIRLSIYGLALTLAPKHQVGSRVGKRRIATFLFDDVCIILSAFREQSDKKKRQ